MRGGISEILPKVLQEVLSEKGILNEVARFSQRGLFGSDINSDRPVHLRPFHARTAE